MYADRLLGLDLFPPSLYASQDADYLTRLRPYGLPLDSRDDYTKTDWATFAAAMSTSVTLRDAAIGGIVKYIGNPDDSRGFPLGDLYFTGNGTEFFLMCVCLNGCWRRVLTNDRTGTGPSSADTSRSSRSRR